MSCGEGTVLGAAGLRVGPRRGRLRWQHHGFPASSHHNRASCSAGSGQNSNVAAAAGGGGLAGTGSWAAAAIATTVLSAAPRGHGVGWSGVCWCLEGAVPGRSSRVPHPCVWWPGVRSRCGAQGQDLRFAQQGLHAGRRGAEAEVSVSAGAGSTLCQAGGSRQRWQVSGRPFPWGISFPSSADETGQEPALPGHWGPACRPPSSRRHSIRPASGRCLTWGCCWCCRTRRRANPRARAQLGGGAWDPRAGAAPLLGVSLPPCIHGDRAPVPLHAGCRQGPASALGSLLGSPPILAAS